MVRKQTYMNIQMELYWGKNLVFWMQVNLVWNWR